MPANKKRKFADDSESSGNNASPSSISNQQYGQASQIAQPAGSSQAEQLSINHSAQSVTSDQSLSSLSASTLAVTTQTPDNMQALALSNQNDLLSTELTVSEELGLELAKFLFNVTQFNFRSNVPQHINDLLSRGAHPNYIYTYDNKRKTLLHLASCRDEWVRILLDFGADANLVDEEGYTPLYDAARFYNKKVFTQLLPVTQDKNPVINKQGETLLHMCLVKPEITTILTDWLAAGIDPNVQDSYGNTPLHYLAYFHCINPQVLEKGLKALIDVRADINIPDSLGLTPLHVIAIALNPDLRRQHNKYNSQLLSERFDKYQSHLITAYNLLLDYGAERSLRDKFGRTADELIPDWVSGLSNIRLLRGRMKRSVLSLLGVPPASRNVLAIEGSKPLALTAGSGAAETNSDRTTLLLTGAGIKAWPAEAAINSAANPAVVQPEVKAIDTGAIPIEQEQEPIIFKNHSKKYWRSYALGLLLALGVAAILTVPGIGFAFGLSAAVGYAVVSTGLQLCFLATGLGILTFALVTLTGIGISTLQARRKGYARIEGAVPPGVPSSSFTQVPQGEAAAATAQADIHTITPVTPNPIGAVTADKVNADAQAVAVNLAKTRSNQPKQF